MGIAAFILRSVKLSVAVALRMLPILLLSLAALALLYQLLSSSPIAFFAILAAFYLPMLVFLFLNAVRAGLMSLRATAPVDLKRLMTFTVRVMRFNFMLNNVIVGVIGVGSAVIAVLALKPDLVTQLRESAELKSLDELAAVFALIGQLPLFILPVIAVGMCISIGANGGSIAASAASAAARGPNHDLLFGLARQFGHLFILGFVVLVFPLLLLQYAVGGVNATLADIFSIGWAVLAALPVYFGWAICAVAAGMAISYVLTLSDDDLAKITATSELMGAKHAPDEIRALRQARQRMIDGEDHTISDDPQSELDDAADADELSQPQQSAEPSDSDSELNIDKT